MDQTEPIPLVRILIVDDHGIVREALKILIERESGLQVVGSARNGAEAIEAAEELRPDLIIMDLMMSDMNGADATQRILTLHPSIRIIVLSACRGTEHVRRALRAGSRGYVVKDAVASELMLAVHTVMAGRPFLSPGITPLLIDRILGNSMGKSPMECLSAREREVLHRIVAGASSADIATNLSLSRKTVDTYRGRLMAKLGVGNKSALIRLAIEHELMVV
jgi:DNA-binding NarL/FixJ family response regulator